MKNKKNTSLLNLSINKVFCFTTILTSVLFFSSCSVSKKLEHHAKNILLSDSVISSGHVGISIYDPAADKYLYNYNSTKYFIPASNTKLFTLYAGLKYLGDSLTGLFYSQVNDSTCYIVPSGDPTFLHPDFSDQPVFDFLKNTYSKNYLYFKWKKIWKEIPLGKGWAWDDYLFPYMAQRSPFPMYGNLIKFKWNAGKITHVPSYQLFDPLFYYLDDVYSHDKFKVTRLLGMTNFNFITEGKPFDSISLPLSEMDRFMLARNILLDTLDRPSLWLSKKITGDEDSVVSEPTVYHRLYSRPSDSLFIPMIHNSDNFFAEQTLLMVSNEKLGYMSDEDIIDTLLKTDLKDIPQKPRWVDGSGLSRYNLFTPKSFIYILNKMKNEFGLEHLKNILPTGGEGTLKNYFTSDSGYIFAKTGSMSNQAGICGFLETKKGKLLIFSVLNNNFQGKTSAVRQKAEQFLNWLRENY